ncbi:MAG: DUF2585 family protein [Verrucomicrobiales bacterium]|nr:DUF2585 family protein [Verrucomicrobiales bacterium]
MLFGFVGTLWKHGEVAADSNSPVATPKSPQSEGSSWSRIVAVAIALVVVTAITEFVLGRTFFGPDGKFGIWEGSIWSDHCSQRIADPYSFSHIAHGMVFYAGLWWVGRRLPVPLRFLMAVGLEAGWEVLENSPIIIERYRQATIALGYEGDSILNSISDVIMMSLGFLAAWRWRPWITATVLVAMELGCALWVRDNLTLNVIMLIRPIEAIKAWQSAGQPGP